MTHSAGQLLRYMSLSSYLSWVWSVRAFGLPDWESEPPCLLLVKNLTFGEAAALQRLIPGRLGLLCHRRAQSRRWKRLLGGWEECQVSAQSTRKAREWLTAQLSRGHTAVFCTRGFSPEAVDEILQKCRLPLRTLQISRESRLDLNEDHLILSLTPFVLSLRVYVDDVIQPADYCYETLQMRQLALSERALSEHEALQGSLAEACIRGLKRRQFANAVTDAGQQGKELSCGMMLAVAWEFSLLLRKLPNKRIGIVLPPGVAGILANLACVLADKVPVNLNFTAGRAAVESAYRIGGIETIVSASQLVDRFPDFPWTEQMVDIAEHLKKADKWSILKKRGAVGVLSSGELMKRIGCGGLSNHDEAGLLFTSGSSGEPKGVPLSHRNILANVAQIAPALPLREIPTMLGCLPLFHSMGFTVGVWWPLICGPRVVSYPSPLELNKLIEVIREFEPALYLTTPTFLRALMKKASRQDLKPLSMVVTGAEKCPPALKEEFEQIFGVPLCEGYGMTETTPVVSVNRLEEKERFIPGPVTGTVGPLLPGINVRTCEPGTGRRLPPGSSGVLWFSGANVFRGYLGLPEKNREVLEDGWYCSGDVGRLNREGFLTIEGRVSRFSKIGGEMVPHGKVETVLMDLARQSGQEIRIAVFGVEDLSKGEILVALCEGCPDESRLRQAFRETGMPNLWWPKTFVEVDSLPSLASGKLDLKACQELARERA